MSQGLFLSIHFHNSILIGSSYYQEGFNRGWFWFSEVYQMDKCTFFNLVDILVPHLEDSFHFSAYKQVIICLSIVANHSFHCLSQERFQHLGETIAANTMLTYSTWRKCQKTSSLMQSQTIMSPPIFHPIQKRSPWFKGCIDKLNRTLIPVIIPDKQ